MWAFAFGALTGVWMLAFLSIGSRRIEYLSCTSEPNTAWMLQQARNLLMDLDDHEWRSRCGGGGRPALLRMLRTEVAETVMSSLRSSPTIHR
jgi:hypothetical protein